MSLAPFTKVYFNDWRFITVRTFAAARPRWVALLVRLHHGITSVAVAERSYRLAFTWYLFGAVLSFSLLG